MSKQQISILGLLALSLVINATLLLRPAPKESVAASQQPTGSVGNLSPTKSKHHQHHQHLEANLTEAESRNIAVAEIDSRFTHERDELRTIRDPWLTIDEIYTEGLVRFEKIREAEQRRRDALEELTGQRWSRVDYDYSWSRLGIFLTGCAIIAGQQGEAAHQVSAIMVEGARKIGMVKSTPFGVSTPKQKEEIHEIVLRQEEKLREQMDNEQFEELFKPFVMSTLEDVRCLKQRFGREATEEERATIVKLVMPEHPLAEIIDRTTVSEGHFSRELLQELRPGMDDGTFAHLLAYQKQYQQSDGCDWEPVKRLKVFDFETARNRAGLEAILDSNQLEIYRTSKRGAWLSATEDSTE